MATQKNIARYADKLFSEWPAPLQEYARQHPFDSYSQSSVEKMIGDWLDSNIQPPGRPRKTPGTLAHDTRDRHFHQIEQTPLFESAIREVRILLAAQRSTPSHPVTWEQVSINAAVRYATIQFAKEHFRADEYFDNLKVPPSS